MSDAPGHNSSKHIESELAEYRERQRIRYLDNKRRSSTCIPMSYSCSLSEAKTNPVPIKVNDSLHSYSTNRPTSSSEIYTNANDVKCSYSGDIYGSNCKPADSINLDGKKCQPSEQGCAQNSVTSSSLGVAEQDSTNSWRRKDKANKTRGSKKNTSNSSSGVISSLKSWTCSLFNRSSKQDKPIDSISPRNTGSIIDAETRNSIVQAETQTYSASRIHFSDEELARRMQIEELNSLEEFYVAGGLNFPSYIVGNFQETGSPPNITVSSSNEMATNPFQGTPYKFELQSSEDEH
ncbi:hypothetical protein OJ253_2309 [Cryptosporidium canis]|uniref:Uncharacterized protein n=1 Tax=Cryptosporidium canis TaxID=195482 RepID=A0A9D5HX23_9CRYT|nr:hypothetical protein OJ253_2309 [Cryptosporidium canis]